MANFDGGSMNLIATEVCPHCGTLKKTEKKEKVKKEALPYMIMGWIFTAISFLFIPLLFGAVALCMGLITYFDRSKAHGVLLMSCAAVGIIIGSVISIMVSGTVFI
jgi:hypothetical protein